MIRIAQNVGKDGGIVAKKVSEGAALSIPGLRLIIDENVYNPNARFLVLDNTTVEQPQARFINFEAEIEKHVRLRFTVSFVIVDYNASRHELARLHFDIIGIPFVVRYRLDLDKRYRFHVDGCHFLCR